MMVQSAKLLRGSAIKLVNIGTRACRSLVLDWRAIDGSYTSRSKVFPEAYTLGFDFCPDYDFEKLVVILRVSN